MTTLDDSGFVVALNGADVVSVDMNEKAFLVEPTLIELQQNPKLIPLLSSNAMQDHADVEMILEPGKSVALRLGVMLEPYDAAKETVAQMVLVSFQIEFSNGKTWQFRRGIPIPNLIAQSTN